MPGRLRKIGLACAIVLTLAGCGGGGETIPSDHSQQLLELLDEIESEVQNGNCDDAAERATAFAQTVEQLPEDVDPKVRQGLSEASVQLVDLATDPTECADTGTSGASGVEPTEEPTTVEEEAPTTTTTEDSETTTAEEPEEDEPEESPPPAEDPSSEGNGPPLTTPSGNTPGSGGRGTAESGGLEPEKGDGAQRGRPAPPSRRPKKETP